jgi:hypothetical protein
MSKDSDIFGEIKEIRKMISGASSLLAIRQEVSKVMKSGFLVMDGRHHVAGNGYDVVVKCGSEEESVARRLRASIPDAKIERITSGVLGIKTARRMKNFKI